MASKCGCQQFINSPPPRNRTQSIVKPMHQSHNIPWDLIEANFKFVHEDKRYTPPKSGLISNDRPQAGKELTHFVKKFIEAIQIFSKTERAKYPAKFAPMMTGKVFCDELLEKHPRYLSKRIQPIEYWLTCGGYRGELMEAVNVLLAENEMETLLMLAQHPRINMPTLHYYNLGLHFGFCQAREAALSSYLFFNTFEAIGKIEKGEYTLDSGYWHLLTELTTPMDFSAYQIPHYKFFRECNALSKEKIQDATVHTDYGRYQRYMKDLFALIYRYDVLTKECGLDPKWEKEVVLSYPLRVHPRKWDEQVSDWVFA